MPASCQKGSSHPQIQTTDEQESGSLSLVRGKGGVGWSENNLMLNFVGAVFLSVVFLAAIHKFKQLTNKGRQAFPLCVGGVGWSEDNHMLNFVGAVFLSVMVLFFEVIGKPSSSKAGSRSEVATVEQPTLLVLHPTNSSAPALGRCMLECPLGQLRCPIVEFSPVQRQVGLLHQRPHHRVQLPDVFREPFAAPSTPCTVTVPL